MADLKYQVEIDTRNAQRSLSDLKNNVVGFGSAIAGAFAFKEVTQISARFQDLRTTLQLLYKDAATGSAAFEEIKAFAASSIFSVEDLTATFVKLKAAGIDPTISLLKMFADTSSVAADSVGALQAITDLYSRTTAGGLGLEDLNRLADRGIPVFTILQDRLGLSRLEISKVGQSAEGAAVILKALEDGLTSAFGGATDARANNVSQAISNFGDAISNAADTIGQSGLNQGMSDLIRSMSELVKSMGPVLEILGKGLGAALTYLAENLKILTSLALGFLAAFALGRIVAITAAIIGLAKALNLTNLVIGKSPVGLLQRALVAAGAAFGLLSASAIDMNDEIAKIESNPGTKVITEGKLGSGTEDLKEKVKALNQELNKFKVEMNSTVSEFARYNQQTRDALVLDTALIGSAKENAELRRAEADINRKAADEIAKLTEQKAKLTSEEKKQGRGGIIDDTIKQIERQSDADKKAAAAVISASEGRQRARQVELFSIKSQIDLQEQIYQVQDDIAKSTMTGIEQKYYDIEAAAKKSARAAIQAEEARIGRPLDSQEQQQYYQEAIKGVNELKSAEETAWNTSRSGITGLQKALNEYVDDATNAAKNVENVFKKATQGMEDMIVNFAKTGKLEWKGFVNSMLEELLRSQIKQTMASLFNVGGMGQGASGSVLGGLLGFASGGVIPTNRPVLVGERGPEILTGAGGRTVIPNDAFAGSSSVTYNISAVDAMSFKQMIASDPGFIHAIAMQGGKSTPTRR
jgi:lambda family phage tail tape measure protein